MLKKSIAVVTLLLAFIGTASAVDKIGVVDMQAVVAETPQFKAINDKIQKKFKERTDALKAMQKKGEDLQAKGKRDAMTLTNVQKLELQRELQALDVDFNLKKKFLEEDIKLTNNQERAKVMNSINIAIQKVAKKNKLDLVLMKNVTVHVSNKIDITDKVIKILSNPAG
ncbi:OmpH family outer membrane protein [Aliikangiella sp. IMCC44359]|uniref:OmpH family outer membrane protein n=1 Tax=Aliikangiella sp. IMCC44359 TaxID=3459125 RepID=UPI00403AD5B7